MQNLSLAEAWKLYRAQVIPPNAPSVQIKESKRAFYAGAQASFHALTSIDDSLPDVEGVAIIEGINVELQTFKKQVESGRA